MLAGCRNIGFAQDAGKKYLAAFQRERPGRNGSARSKLRRSFVKRHNKVIKFSKSTKQEQARFVACNGEFFATHFATDEKRIPENNIDTECLCNRDECGVMPGNNVFCEGLDLIPV